MKDKDFDIILSKNRIARELKDAFKEANWNIPESVLFDFDEIEKKTGTANQPTVREILTTNMDI